MAGCSASANASPPHRLTASADPRDALVRRDRLRRKPSQRAAALALRAAALALISYARRFTRLRDTLVKTASALR